MRIQPRDKPGRFLSFDGTRPPKKLYTVEDIKEAFMAGIASHCSHRNYAP